MANPIRVIGVGPGHPDYLIPAALKSIRSADVLVGGERVLQPFAELGKEFFTVKNNLPAMVEFIQARRRQAHIAVLASGDPAFFGILEYLKRYFAKSELVVWPGLSSVQLACARVGVSWHDAVFFSVHGRAGGGLEDLVRTNAKVVVLTDPQNTPAVIAGELARAGIRQKRIYVCEHLSYEHERIGEYSITGVPADAGAAGCVLIISDE